jgi:hypothetical protein
MESNHMNCTKCNNHLFVVMKRTFSNGTSHVGAVCSECNSHLCWISPKDPEVAELTPIGEIEIPFGKFKGTKLKDLECDYLNWMLKNTDSKFNNNIKKYLEEKN